MAWYLSYCHTHHYIDIPKMLARFHATALSERCHIRRVRVAYLVRIASRPNAIITWGESHAVRAAHFFTFFFLNEISELYRNGWVVYLKSFIDHRRGSWQRKRPVQWVLVALWDCTCVSMLWCLIQQVYVIMTWCIVMHFLYS